jgi:hypothetical protein
MAYKEPKLDFLNKKIGGAGAPPGHTDSLAFDVMKDLTSSKADSMFTTKSGREIPITRARWEGPFQDFSSGDMSKEDRLRMINTAYEFDRSVGWPGWDNKESIDELMSFLGRKDVWQKSPSGKWDDPDYQVIPTEEIGSYGRYNKPIMKPYEIGEKLKGRLLEKRATYE